MKEKYAAQKKYYYKNQELIKQKAHDYYEANKERKKEQAKNYYYQHHDESKLKKKLYYYNNKVKIKEKKVYDREWYRNYYRQNREKYRLYYERHKHKVATGQPIKKRRPFIMDTKKLINVDMKNVRIDNVDLLYEVILSKGKGERTEKMDNMIVEMTAKLVEKFNFNITYDEKQDLLNAGVLRALETFHTFNEVKYDNAFNYFTEVIKRAFANEYNKVKALKQASNKRTFQFVPISPYL